MVIFSSTSTVTYLFYVVTFTNLLSSLCLKVKKKIAREKCVIARNTRLPNRKVILRTLLARKYWVDSASFRAFLPRNSSSIADYASYILC